MRNVTNAQLHYKPNTYLLNLTKVSNYVKFYSQKIFLTAVKLVHVNQQTSLRKFIVHSFGCELYQS